MIRLILKLRHILRMGNYDFVETSMVIPATLACWATHTLQTRLVYGIHDIYRRDHQNSWAHKFLRFSVNLNRDMQFYAISKRAMQHWIEYARIKAERIRVIYNSISKDHFAKARNESKIEGIPGINSGENKVLFVGRLRKRKGLDTLIKALGPILKEEGVHLIIVGETTTPEPFYPGDVNLIDRLSKQIESSSWSDRVHFTGFRDDIPQIMNSIDVFVHPARKEGFGLVLAEALAAGLPIVASNIGGIPEVLAKTDSVLVPPDDPLAVRNAVLEVLRRTPAETARCRRKARKRAEYFRPERRIEDMLAMFRHLSNHQ